MSFQVVLFSALLQVVGPSAGKQNPPGEARPEHTNPLGGIKQHYVEPPPLAPQDVNLVAMLHQTVAQEITLGAMARQQAQSHDARAFGDRLLRDQVQADLLLRDYIRAHAIALPEATEQERMQNDRMRLSGLRGGEFDRAFVQMALGELDRLLAQLRSGQARDPGLRHLIDRLMPILEQDRQLARDVSARRS
jgi:predicted outer membrane protein